MLSGNSLQMEKKVTTELTEERKALSAALDQKRLPWYARMVRGLKHD